MSAGSDPRAGERLPRAARLRAGNDIRRVLRRGRRVRSGPVDVHLADSPSGRPRVGVVVARFGHTVAERNRLKRRLREIARREWLPRAGRAARPRDLLIRARPEAYDVSYGVLREELRATFEGLAFEGLAESDRPARNEEEGSSWRGD